MQDNYQALKLQDKWGRNKLIFSCEIPRRYPTRAIRMTRTYKLSTDKNKQDRWPTIQNTALRSKISFKSNSFFRI